MLCNQYFKTINTLLLLEVKDVSPDLRATVKLPQHRCNREELRLSTDQN